jgi:hypothetical protein
VYCWITIDEKGCHQIGCAYVVGDEEVFLEKKHLGIGNKRYA